MITDRDLRYLRRCVDLAVEALDAGDNPFGSVLVAADGSLLREARNEVSGGDRTRHPEFELARWAAANLSQDARAVATVYTSGEHCPMCSAAHGWVGLGRIVYAASAAQVTRWREEFGGPPSPVVPLPIPEVIVDAVVDGPVSAFSEELRELHRRRYGRVT